MSREFATVYVVDDDPSILTSVGRLLRASGFKVRPFASAEAFLAGYDPDIHACVVADLEMPAMSGMELQQVLLEAEGSLPIVFLTGRGDIRAGVTAMREGAVDFVTKTAPKSEFLSAVERALDRNAKEREARVKRREMRERFDRLTPRDREVLVHVLRGWINKEIAAELGVDERSVKRHRTSLMRKLEVSSVVELAVLAHEAGFRGAEQPAEESIAPA